MPLCPFRAALACFFRTKVVPAVLRGGQWCSMAADEHQPLGKLWCGMRN
jgi:hypothetical protein